MSYYLRKRCVFGCDGTVSHTVHMHRFPNPEKDAQRFSAWVSAVGDILQESDKKKIYQNKLVCDHHFADKFKTASGRLIMSAIPSVNLKRIEQTNATFTWLDHNYCNSKRQVLADITNLASTSTAIGTTPIVEFQPPLPGPSISIGIEQTNATFTWLDHNNCNSKRQVLADITNLASTSTAIGTTPIVEFQPPLPGPSISIVKSREDQMLKDRKIKQMKNEVRRLRQKMKNMKFRQQQMRKFTDTRYFEKVTENIPDSAKLFTRMQCIEGKKKSKGRRFTLDEKILSLSLFKKSPKAYTLLRKHFTLPSKKVIKSLLSQVHLHPGINENIFKELKTTVDKMLLQDRLCTLIFDEMSISPQIHYNAYTDDLVGFENYGESKTQYFANHVLVFMVKGIKKKFKQPVAYYFTQALKKNKLKEILNKIISKLQATGLKVVATVCDQSSVNVSTINELIIEAKSVYSQAGKEWKKDIIIINKNEIIPLFDVPHLFKGIRNNLLNKELQYTYENQLKIVKWEYFQRVFEADRSHGELRILPKLTIEHVDPNKIKKMRVKNATQIFSHSMAVATDHLVARGDIASECKDIIPFVLLMDKLFDSLNSSNFQSTDGKIYRAAVKLNSPHHSLWQESLKMLKTVKFMGQNKEEKVEKSVPSVNNMIRTIEGFKAIWQLLNKKYLMDSVLTRNFNQDPLENFFGSVRSLGARNIAPNCVGFEGAFKTLLLNNLSSNHSSNANCEEDSNDCLQSLKFLIKNTENFSKAPSQSQSIVIDEPLNLMRNSENVSDSGADQRAYVCGWALTKCLQKVVKGCKHCRSKLLSNSVQEVHKLIRSKEYTKNKKWLCYPSELLVDCFKDIQETTVAFLNSECYKPNIRERIKAFLDLFADFSLFDCEIHKEKLKQCFVDTSINIIIYSWCRSLNRILGGKLTYDGEDSVKKAAQLYFNKHKTYKR